GAERLELRQRTFNMIQRSSVRGQPDVDVDGGDAQAAGLVPLNRTFGGGGNALGVLPVLRQREEQAGRQAVGDAGSQQLLRGGGAVIADGLRFVHGKGREGGAEIDV